MDSRAGNTAQNSAVGYELGLALAIRETQLGEQVVPEECPYTPEQVMNPEFLPESNQADG